MYGILLPKLLGFLLVTTLTLITAIDVSALVRSEPSQTVSYIIWQWGREYPSLYFFVGLLVGHILFPLVLLTNGNHPR